MPDFKFIREGRMGPPKAYKTGAVIGTYPRPLICLQGDEGGMDIIPKLPADTKSPFKMEVTQKDLVWIKPTEIDSYTQKETKDLSPITAVSFSDSKQGLLTGDFAITPDPKNFPSFNAIGNALIKKCPWKTVVIDPVTVLQGIIYGHLAATNPGALADPRQWASKIGLKVQQTMAEMCKIQAHVIFLMHTETDKIELTGEIRTEAMLYSKFRQLVGGLFSQFLYAEVEGGKPIVYTQSQGFVKGLGCRWPVGLPPKCGAHFKDIYEGCVASGEIENPNAVKV